jgi:cytochrome c
MRLSNLLVVALALAACSPAWAQKPNPNDFGRPATPEDIAKLDFSINPVTGAELPPGHGTAKEGAPLFAAKCAVCHGPTGHEGGVLGNPIVGPKGSRGGIQAVPFASTIWDFINRAMPRFNEGTLTHDQVYALTAVLLFRAGIIEEDTVMDAKSLPKLQMPNRYGFVPSDLAEIGNFEKRACRLGHCPGPDPVTSKPSN